MVVLLAQKHPRYAIASGVGLLVCFLLLASHHESFPKPDFLTKYAGSTSTTPAGTSGSVSAMLAEAEQDYSIAVGRRNALVRKFGPDPTKVEAWPALGQKNYMYTLWDFFLPAFKCPHKVLRIGNLGDGGKWVCGLPKVAEKQKCVIYSVGINGESSFEADLLKATNCEVWGYDYSVKEFGPEIEKEPSLKPRAHFFPYALGGKDNHGPGANPPFYTLPTLMQQNGHDFIDILKIDIEGFEFDVLADLVKAYKGKNLPFGQLQLEIHAWSKSFVQVLSWWQSLEEAGLRPFWTEPNLVYLNLYRGHAPDLAEYSFINIKGNHAIISDS